MLEALDLGVSLPKAEYRERMPHLQNELHQLQRMCWEAKLSAVIVFGGWDVAGRGRCVKKLAERLEPRALDIHTIHEPRTAVRRLPWLYRFWQRLPNWGDMAIFYRSWYTALVHDRAEGRLAETTFRRQVRDIRDFERALADDRYVFVKLFLHISEEEQRRRLEKYATDPITSYLVTDEVWRRHERYEPERRAVEEVLAETETEWGPWTLVEATDRPWARVKVFETVIGTLEAALDRRGVARSDYEHDELLVEALEEDLDG